LHGIVGDALQVGEMLVNGLAPACHPALDNVELLVIRLIKHVALHPVVLADLAGHLGQLRLGHPRADALRRHVVNEHLA
jgi:hypothetical protein